MMIMIIIMIIIVIIIIILLDSDVVDIRETICSRTDPQYGRIKYNIDPPGFDNDLVRNKVPL